MTSINALGKTVHSPWGTYKIIEMMDGFQAKTITVIPGGSLSLQSHVHRAEHWVVVRGVATVTVDETQKDYSVNEYIFVPKGAKHRLENKTDEMVLLIEVQVGDYLGEDDITRYDDIYGRS